MLANELDSFAADAVAAAETAAVADVNSMQSIGLISPLYHIARIPTVCGAKRASSDKQRIAAGTNIGNVCATLTLSVVTDVGRPTSSLRSSGLSGYLLCARTRCVPHVDESLCLPERSRRQ